MNKIIIPFLIIQWQLKPFVQLLLQGFMGPFDVKIRSFRRSSLIQVRIFSILIINELMLNLNYFEKLHFSNIEEGFFTGKLWKISFLELSFSSLTSLSWCTARISIINSWWFEHVKSKTLVFWIRGNNLRRAKWSNWIVKSICI